MILQSYTVLDRAVNAFSRPWYAHARAEAIRTFSDAVNDKDSPFAKHPEDFSLYYCGEFDDSKGVFTQEEPEKIITALECLPAK